jgi:hypothetical protein
MYNFAKIPITHTATVSSQYDKTTFTDFGPHGSHTARHGYRLHHVPHHGTRFHRGDQHQRHRSNTRQLLHPLFG